jgi:hypothetical protein
VSVIPLAEAAEEHPALRDELIAGRCKAVGSANGNGLPVSIPSNHFAIAWEQPTPTAMKPIGGGEPGRLVVHDGSPPWGALPKNFLYPEPWLDVNNGAIYAADGTAQWIQVRVEGQPTERIPLPKRNVSERPGSKQPAAWYALDKLYGRNGYPKVSMKRLTELVNIELSKSCTPPKFQIKVGSDTVQRLLDRRR